MKILKLQKSESHTADDWGFLFLITFINGFQLRTIKRFYNRVNEKRQNNKSNKFKIIKVIKFYHQKRPALISLSTGKRILERVLDDNPKTSSEKSKLEYLKKGAEREMFFWLK